MDIPIEEFYLPNSKLRKYMNQNDHAKTIKKSYIKLLCKSPSFRSEFESYLQDEFLQKYLKNR